MNWSSWIRRVGGATVLAAALAGAGAIASPSVRAQVYCDSTFSIVPADGSFSYSITPICDNSAANVDVVIPTPGGGVVSSTGGAVITGVGAVGYTSPGNTPYVNGAPDRSPYSNISVYTPYQAAAARASGNPSATANAYSQYGGYTAPGNTATRNQAPATLVQGY